jgi:hypothetical protein
MMIASIVTSAYFSSKSKSVLFLHLLAALIEAPVWAQTQLWIPFATSDKLVPITAPGLRAIRKNSAGEHPGSIPYSDRSQYRGTRTATFSQVKSSSLVE